MKKLSLFLFLLTLPLLLIAEEREPGWRIPSTPLYLGGYFSAEYIHTQEEKLFDIDDLAMLLYGEWKQFDFLGETEVADLYKKESGHYHDEQFNTTFHIERLYLTWYFGESESLRIGKFNSPVGYWNRVPINLYRATTSSPYLVRGIFPKLTSGIRYRHTFAQKSLQSLTLILQDNEEIDASYNNFVSDRHLACLLDFDEGMFQWQTGGGYFRSLHTRQNRYLFAAFHLDTTRADWQGEGALRLDHSGHWLHALYLQSVWHLFDKSDLILRAEHNRDATELFSEGVGVAGIAYRPDPNIAIKAEYEVHSHLQQRLLFSCSMLF